MSPLFSPETITFKADGPPRYEQLARFIEQAIGEGRLHAGERLPTVRQLAADLTLSPTTITAALDLLTRRGLVRAEVGRGTFVTDRLPERTPASPGFPRSTGRSLYRSSRAPWRRRALMNLGARVRSAYPNSLDCSTGRPDPALLPLEVLRRAWSVAMQHVNPRDLQYAGPDAIPLLGERLVPVLESDGVPARPQDMVVGSSAQQFLVLSLEIVASLWGLENAVIAVEEPGYPTIFDTWERAGARLIGVEVDESGAVPESLDAALRKGAKAVLFTPRAQNPTGSSWSAARRSALGDVLAAHADVIAIEDDQFAGIATSRPGSLLSDARVHNRTVYIRSLSKSIGPDLRIAVAVAHPQLRELLVEAKSFADGWTSRLLQRTLAEALADGELSDALNRSRDLYNERRVIAAEVVNAILRPHGGGTVSGDGLNLWVHLPAGTDAKDVVERSAAGGVRVADGEAFFISPGNSKWVRLNAGSAQGDQASAAGRTLAESALTARWSKQGPIHV